MFDLYGILIMILSVLVITLPKKYLDTNNYIYFLFGLIAINFSYFVIWKMLLNKYDIITMTIFIKILPVIILTFIDYYIYKNNLTIQKILAIIFVLVGSYILVKS
jgi:drug/metabolite transporter (DMT)-like permease